MDCRNSKKIRSNFVTIDLARKADGNLVIMELGDGQVSGLQQIEPSFFYNLFTGQVSIEELLEDKGLVVAIEPLKKARPEEILINIENINSVQELVSMYVNVHNKFWYIEDAIYDYLEGSEDYNKAKEKAEIWQDIMERLEIRVIEAAKQEGLFDEELERVGLIERLVPFMQKYGYRDGRGWWVKNV